MPEIYLNQIAHGRSGDKGDTSNVCIFARKPEYYPILQRELTVEKVRAHFGEMVKGEITRYEVPTLDGKVKYSIPAGTQSGTTFRLREKGIKYLRSDRHGDMFVKMNVVVPRKLTDRQNSHPCPYKG